MGDFLTAEDDGELERRVHKERRKRITEKFSKQFMWEVESINAKIAAGISVGDESNAVLAKVKDIQDAATEVIKKIPSGKTDRKNFHPHKENDWPSE
tara:strand:+ start:250 stop:540 length:291 start_codon:yes stop_codon:yes gene_type:complete